LNIDRSFQSTPVIYFADQTQWALQVSVGHQVFQLKRAPGRLSIIPFGEMLDCDYW
jgi:hypothetical protein